MDKNYTWDPARGRQLFEQRGVSFEDVVFYIRQGGLLDILCRPRQDQASQQCVLVVEIDAYVYLVPYVETNETFFLQAITPSRQATRQYLGEGA